MRSKFPPLLLVLFTTSFILGATAPAPAPQDGLNLPEQRHDYIVKLLERRHYDLVLEQADLFLRLHGDSPLGDDVERCAITACLAATPPDYAHAAQRITGYLRRHKKSPHQRQYRLQLGLCYLNTKQPETALKYLLPLTKDQDGTAESALYYAAHCYLALQNRDAATPLLDRLAQLPLSARHPLRIAAARYIANAKSAAGDHSGAAAIYGSILQSKDLEQDVRAETLFAAAILAFRRLQDYALAAEYLGAFIAENPRSPQNREARRLLIDCRLQLHDDDSFAALAEQYRRDFPAEAQRDLNLCWQTAAMHLRHSAPHSAIPLLKNIFSDPHCTSNMREAAIMSYAGALHAVGDYRAVRQCIGEFLASSPNSAHKPFLLALDGDAALALKDDETAIDSYSRALPLLTASPALYCTVGQKLAALQQQHLNWAGAAGTWESVAAAAPDAERPPLLLRAASCYQQVPDPAKATAIIDPLLKTPQALSPQLRIAARRLRYDLAVAQKDGRSALENVQALVELAEGQDKFDYLMLMARLQINAANHAAAIETCKNALLLPALTPRQHADVLIFLIYWELRRKEEKAALDHANELFALSVSPPIPPQLLDIIASTARRHQNTVLSSQAAQYAIAQPDCPDRLRLKLTLVLAENSLDTAPEKARELANGLLGGSASPSQPDAEAILAETELAAGNPEDALIHANRALAPAPETILSNTIPRALWVKATVLLKRDRAADEALRFATPAYLMYGNCQPYAERCRQIAREIYQGRGDENALRMLKQ